MSDIEISLMEVSGRHLSTHQKLSYGRVKDTRLNNFVFSVGKDQVDKSLRVLSNSRWLIYDLLEVIVNCKRF